MWFWHAAFGYPGSLNDINILNLSPLLSQFTDGSFQELERNVVLPFRIGNTTFNSLFLLVDGIRFVRSIRQPLTAKEQLFAKWQEASRKDECGESFWCVASKESGKFWHDPSKQSTMTISSVHQRP